MICKISKIKKKMILKLFYKIMRMIYQDAMKAKNLNNKQF